MASVTWDGIKFTATENGVGVLDLSDTRQNTDLMTLVCSTERGYIFRGSCGEYPWSSAVILATRVNDKIEVYAYPTEINPSGELEVDYNEEKVLLELEPKIFLREVPFYNSLNDCYSWEVYLEGQSEGGLEIGKITTPHERWKTKHSKVVFSLNKTTERLWVNPEYDWHKYLQLPEAKLEQLKSAPATDEEDEYD